MRIVLAWIAGLVIVVGLTVFYWFWSYTTTVSPGNGSVVVQIPKGVGVRAIGALLEEQKLITNDIRFLVLVRLNGSASKLRAGEYQIEYGLTPVEVLQVLAHGKVYYHSVTVPEGMTALEIAEIFSKAGWGKVERYLELLSDKKIPPSFGVEQVSLEGYLFPDTYYLTKGEMDEKKILAMMTDRFFEIIKALPYKKSEFSLHQIVTLASIVEKETGAASERPLIARVFLNRLQKKMRLQSDPTVIYGIPEFNGNITKADLRRATPYNTYVIAAIPPGPICSPGKESIKAVLSPAYSEALFFVSKNDGTHFFSKTLREHNRAVRKYQKK